MTRTERIARSRRITAASDIIAAYGTATHRAHRAARLARGQLDAVIAMGASIARTVPQSDYALTA